MPINTAHRDVVKFRPQWERCRDCYEGSDAVKQRKTAYLPMLEGHTADLMGGGASYMAYLQRALFYPVMSRTVAGLDGLLFGKQPNLDNFPESFRAQLNDVTMTGISLTGYGVQVAAQVLTAGRHGTLLDMADSPDPKARPYWVGYQAEQILNWRTSRINGQQVLTSLVLEELSEQPAADDAFAVDLKVQFRLLELQNGAYTVTVYKEDPKDKGRYLPEASRRPLRRGAPLPFIPFVFHSMTGKSPDVEHPPLLDLCDVNLSHYRTSADLEHGAHFTGLPTPYVTGYTPTPGQQLGIGSGNAWVFPDPQARAGMVEYTGQGLGALERLMEQKRLMMATLGARLLETQKTGVEAAETVRLRQAGDASALELLAGVLGRDFSQLLMWHLYWQGVEEATADSVVMSLNPDLLERLTPEEVKTLVTTWQAGAISHQTVYALMQQGQWTRDGITFEEEKQAIEEEVDEQQEKMAAMMPPQPGVVDQQEKSSEKAKGVESEDAETEA